LSAPDALALSGLPRDAEGPVFAEPWQAQAFALAVRLNEEGAFSWAEWATTLAAELARDPSDDGARYYDHWVAALEHLVASRGLVGAAEIERRKVDWAEAYRHTPHGSPVALAASRDRA
jgi:nitrile hydratase accessory protein